MYFDTTPDPRILCWFSCGATSAVATKLICSKPQRYDVVIAYTQVKEEHHDNIRLLKDCEGWFGQDIEILRNEKYGASIYEVFQRERYLAGPYGAPCTKHLKRKVREDFQRQGDIHVLGFSVEEKERADEFMDRNHKLTCWFPLIERNLTKADCLAIVQDAGIELPAMYRLGYEHNNCVGCVKGGAGYWNKIRADFPAVFQRMAETERYIGASLIRVDGVSVYLDTLAPTVGRGQREPDIDCSIFCHLAKQECAP